MESYSVDVDAQINAWRDDAWQLKAWHRLAAHPFFKEAWRVQSLPLVDAMERILDDAMPESAVATQAEEPEEPRILRAFTNGYAEGLRRGCEERLDR